MKKETNKNVSRTSEYHKTMAALGRAFGLLRQEYEELRGKMQEHEAAKVQAIEGALVKMRHTCSQCRKQRTPPECEVAEAGQVECPIYPILEQVQIVLMTVKS